MFHIDENYVTYNYNGTGVTVRFVTSICILGVTIDASLSFDLHVTKTIASCNNYIRALKHIRSSLTKQAAITIACSLINTRLDYCNSLLYHTSSYNLVRLQRVQNNVARAVFMLRRQDSVRSSIRDLHWLRIDERINYKIAVLTYRAVNSHKPIYLSEFLNPQACVRSLRSGSRTLLAVPHCKLRGSDSGFHSAAPSVWNNLSEYVKTSSSLDVFKRRLKSELFARSS